MDRDEELREEGRQEVRREVQRKKDEKEWFAKRDRPMSWFFAILFFGWILYELLRTM